jgi:hypothetical protein
LQKGFKFKIKIIVLVYKLYKVSSSNIPGIKVEDILELDVVFEASTKEASLANISGPGGITCAILTIETLNAN